MDYRAFFNQVGFIFLSLFYTVYSRRMGKAVHESYRCGQFVQIIRVAQLFIFLLLLW